jgi:hypothetical protein
VILAIASGISANFALLGDGTLVDDLPIHPAQHGRSAMVRAELDLNSFFGLLAGHAIGRVFTERVAVRPGQGVTSIVPVRRSPGHGLLVGLGLAVTFATPQQWERFHQVDSTRCGAPARHTAVSGFRPRCWRATEPS